MAGHIKKNEDLPLCLFRYMDPCGTGAFAVRSLRSKQEYDGFTAACRHCVYGCGFSPVPTRLSAQP